VLDDGQVVESGRHEDLLGARGLYSELYTTLVRTGGADEAAEPAISA